MAKVVKKFAYSFTPGWEKELEALCLKGVGEKAYICSPLGADTIEEIHRNMLCAREQMYYASRVFDVVAVGPHAYLPILLNDTVADERNLGLNFGVELLSVCQHIFVCGNRISTGMAAEIKYAAKHGITIHCFNTELRSEIMRLCNDGFSGVPPKEMHSRVKFLCHFGGAYAPLGEPSPKEYLVKTQTVQVVLE